MPHAWQKAFGASLQLTRHRKLFSMLFAFPSARGKPACAALNPRAGRKMSEKVPPQENAPRTHPSIVISSRVPQNMPTMRSAHTRWGQHFNRIDMGCNDISSPTCCKLEAMAAARDLQCPCRGPLYPTADLCKQIPTAASARPILAFWTELARSEAPATLL